MNDVIKLNQEGLTTDLKVSTTVEMCVNCISSHPIEEEALL